MEVEDRDQKKEMRGRWEGGSFKTKRRMRKRFGENEKKEEEKENEGLKMKVEKDDKWCTGEMRGRKPRKQEKRESREIWRKTVTPRGKNKGEEEMDYDKKGGGDRWKWQKKKKKQFRKRTSKRKFFSKIISQALNKLNSTSRNILWNVHIRLHEDWQKGQKAKCKMTSGGFTGGHVRCECSDLTLTYQH